LFKRGGYENKKLDIMITNIEIIEDYFLGVIPSGIVEYGSE
jgi:hypothetical protein